MAESDVKADENKQRQDENVRTQFPTAQANAKNAYSKACEGNGETVKKLIYAALTRCAANDDAIEVVAKNMDAILVSSTSNLRSIEQVRERVIRTFKENLLWLNEYKTIEELQEELNRWQHDYNNVFPHSSIANCTPVEYEERWSNGTEPQDTGAKKILAKTSLF